MNRIIFPFPAYPLSGDIQSTPGSNKITVIGLENIPLDAASVGSPAVYPAIINYSPLIGKYVASDVAGSGGGGGGGVTTSGSPVAGNLTQFSAPTVITNADLIGDVVTSGTTFTTVEGFNNTPIDISSWPPANGQVLAYSTSSGKFEPSSVLLGLRPIAISIDGGSGTPATPIVRNVQIGFNGTIVGWSVMNCDTSGSLSCDVDKHSSSAPPSAPAIPNTTTDKISGTAPIVLTTAQSSSGGATAISTWSTVSVSQWDVVQFNITSMTTITRATIIIWVQ